MKQITNTPNAPAAIGPYVQAVSCGKLLFVSGQLGLNREGALDKEVEVQAKWSMTNLGEILKANGLNYDNVLKTTIFLTDMADFAAVNQVYASFFTNGFPARSTVAVAALPKGGLVEVECIASFEI